MCKINIEEKTHKESYTDKFRDDNPENQYKHGHCLKIKAGFDNI